MRNSEYPAFNSGAGRGSGSQTAGPTPDPVLVQMRSYQNPYEPRTNMLFLN
jgi:hypothetical protein